MRRASASGWLYMPPRIVVEDRCAPAIIDEVLLGLESFLKRAAHHLAAHSPDIAADMVQEARIMIWELDIGRFAPRDVAYLHGMLWKRMVSIYRKESRGRLVTGQRTRDEQLGVRISSYP